MGKEFYSTIFDCALSSKRVQSLLNDFDFRNCEEFEDYTNFKNKLNENLQKGLDFIISMINDFYEDCILDNYLIMLNIGIKMGMELKEFFFKFEDE